MKTTIVGTHKGHVDKLAHCLMDAGVNNVNKTYNINDKVLNAEKIIYVYSNPYDSLTQINDISFSKHFDYYAELHEQVINLDQPVLTIIPKRLFQGDSYSLQALSNFCETEPGSFNISQYKISPRKPTYFKYRMANFIWKRLSWLFQFYKQ